MPGMPQLVRPLRKRHTNRKAHCESWTCRRYRWFARWSCRRTDWHLLQHQEHEWATRASIHDSGGLGLLDRVGRTFCRHVSSTASTALDMDSILHSAAVRNSLPEQETGSDTARGAVECLTMLQANPAEHRGCNRGVPCGGSLSLGRWAATRRRSRC